MPRDLLGDVLDAFDWLWREGAHAPSLTRRAASGRLGPSVIVVLELVADGHHHDVGRGLDLDQGDVARPPEGDDQLSQERAVPGLAAGERRGPQGREARADARQGPLGEREIATVALQFALEDEAERTTEVGLGLAGQANPEAPARFLALRTRAASRRVCSAATTSSAST